VTGIFTQLWGKMQLMSPPTQTLGGRPCCLTTQVGHTRFLHKNLHGCIHTHV